MKRSPEMYHPMHLDELSEEQREMIIRHILFKGADKSYTIYVEKDEKTYILTGLTIEKVIK